MELIGQTIITAKETLELRGNGILYCTIHKGAYLSEDDAIEIISAVKSIATNAPIPTLLDLRAGEGASIKARHQFMDSELIKYQSAVAMIIDKGVSYLLASFFMGINKTAFPIKVFTDETKATQWLQQFL